MIRSMSHFSERLNEFLAGLGWTAYKMASASEMNMQYVYKLTSGQRVPEDETLEKIAAIEEFQKKGVTVEVLRNWRSVDRAEEVHKRYDPETIIKAYENLAAKDPEYRAEIKEANRRVEEILKNKRGMKGKFE